MARTSADLPIVRKHPERFSWGKVTKIHDIGAYTVLEYVSSTQGFTFFHLYIDGIDTGWGASSLERSLIQGFARKHLEEYEARQMAEGACKLLGLKNEAASKKS